MPFPQYQFVRYLIFIVPHTAVENKPQCTITTGIGGSLT